MKHRGFTVIELIVVIVIVGILASLTTVQVIRSQAVARDKERLDDVTAIANHLENIYKTGQPDGVPIPAGNEDVSSAVPMGYPSTQWLTSPNATQSKAITNGIDERALFSPYKKSMSLVKAESTAGASSNSGGGVTLGASDSDDLYVYQPLIVQPLPSGPIEQLCSAASANSDQAVIAPRLVNNCVKFNIYYYSEVDQTVKVKQSINQGGNNL